MPKQRADAANRQFREINDETNSFFFLFTRRRGARGESKGAKRIFSILVILAALITGGCAILPEAIAPVEMDNAPYMTWNCEQLCREDAQLTAVLAGESDAQRRCRNKDTAGLLFVGLPVGSLTGCRRTAEIARLKGELQALQHAAEKMECRLDAAEEVLPPGSMLHEEL